MGCTEVKQRSEEEQAVQEAEEVLNFHPHHSANIDTTLRKYSLSNEINTSQLLRISSTLSLCLKNFPPFLKTEDFYAKMQSSEGLYCLQDLLVIGILLSEGEPSTKAGLLFQAFDDGLAGVMNISKIKKELLYKLATHSCRTLPSLVCPGQKYANVIKNEKYIKDMEYAKDECISSVAQRLIVNGENVTEITFVEVFRTLHKGSLTNSKGWREFLYETFLKNPKKGFENLYKTYR